MAANWERADRISDQIVQIINDEVKQPNASSVDILAGQLLALVSYFGSFTENTPIPPPLAILREVVKDCLSSILEEENKRN